MKEIIREGRSEPKDDQMAGERDTVNKIERSGVKVMIA